jgi:MoxR-like ATPase
MVKLKIDYPSKADEVKIVSQSTTGVEPEINKVATVEHLVAARETIAKIYMDPKIVSYIVDVVSATREPKEYGLKIGRLIDFGASPRASIFLAAAARAHAFLRRRGYVIPDDVKAAGMDVLRHRIIPTYEADAENVTPEDLIAQIFDAVEVP